MWFVELVNFGLLCGWFGLGGYSLLCCMLPDCLNCDDFLDLVFPLV